MFFSLKNKRCDTIKIECSFDTAKKEFLLFARHTICVISYEIWTCGQLFRNDGIEFYYKLSPFSCISPEDMILTGKASSDWVSVIVIIIILLIICSIWKCYYDYKKVSKLN